MLTLLLGTDWVANRQQILASIARDVAQEKGGRVLIVPELISHDTERRLCQAAGDTCSRFAEVLSFMRLAQRVSDSLGHAAPQCLDNGGRIVAMAAAARQLHSRLKAYASVETRPEFLSGLLDAVDEFKRCCISPGDLMEASRQSEGSLAQKLEELSLLLEGYDCLCQGGKRDPRDLMTWLLEELQDGDFAANHVFYVDGFPDLTRQHMQILQYLIVASENVTVSLNCDEAGSRAMAFEKAGETAAELLRFARSQGIEVDLQIVPAREDPLALVRRKLFQGRIEEGSVRSGLRVFTTDTLRQECAAAAEEVLTLVHKGARYRDISVVCADIATYKSVLEMVFHRAGIPAYISGTEDILDKTVITTILTALDAALVGLEQQDVIRYLKSALAPIDAEGSDALENYAIIWGISGNLWLKEWTEHPDGLGRDFTESATRRLAAINRDRVRAVEPLEKLREGFRKADRVRDQVLALYEFFEDISLSEHLSKMARELDAQGDNRSAQILNQLWDILVDALEQIHGVLGDTIWDMETFVRLFKLLLSQYDVGTIPPVLDAVTVGPVSAMRCQQVKHLIVLGAQEGSMPGYGGSVGVLTDQERVALREMGVPLTGGAMEGLQAEFAEIYGVFCGAMESICVSCPGGEPAVLHHRLAKLAGGKTEPSFALGAAMGNREEAAAYLVRHNAQSVADELGIGQLYAAMKERIGYGFGTVTRENIRGLYGQMLTLSASQVDRQAECRMYYFLRYGVRAQERKPAAVDPAEFGTYVHDVLENTVKEVMELGGFRQVTLEQMLQLAQKYSRAYAEARFKGIDTQRLNYLFNRNSAELEGIVRELWQELSTSGFEPVAFELGFGKEGQVPAIDVSGKTMDAHLEGFVDRVDAWKDGADLYYRVVDYKTGKKDFDYCDVYNGYGLQMLLYLFALEEGGQTVLGDTPIPAGVEYFPARVPLVSADGLLTDEQAEEERRKLWKRRGLLLSWENVLNAMEPLETATRLPCSKKKDGTISGDIADRGQFALLKTYVFSLVSKMVDEIASGNVTPNPYTRGTSHNACAFCPYGDVCHKDNVSGRRNYKAVSAQKFWEDVERQVKQDG